MNATWMARVVCVALVAVVLAPAALAQGDSPDYFVVTEDTVKMDKWNEYEQLAALRARLAAESGFALPAYASQTGNEYQYVFPVEGLDGIQEVMNAAGEAASKNPEAWQALYANMEKCLEASALELVMHLPELSYVPDNPRISMEEAGVRQMITMCPEPARDREFVSILREYKELCGEKGIATGYGVYRAITGDEQPAYIVGVFAKDRADLYAQQEKDDETLGAAGMQLQLRAVACLRKMEEKIIMIRRDLSYIPGVTTAAAEGEAPNRVSDIPQRNPMTPANLIDLSEYYNAATLGTWHPNQHWDEPLREYANDLSYLPTCIQPFGGVSFDVRGLVQVTGARMKSLGGEFPESVEGIEVGMKGDALHFLLAAGWGNGAEDPKAGAIVVHYADGSRESIELTVGETILDWWYMDATEPTDEHAAIAWRGPNPFLENIKRVENVEQDIGARLVKLTWPNPKPDLEIESLSLVSAMNDPSPFLVAVTVEE